MSLISRPLFDSQPTTQHRMARYRNWRAHCNDRKRKEKSLPTTELVPVTQPCLALNTLIQTQLTSKPHLKVPCHAARQLSSTRRNERKKKEKKEIWACGPQLHFRPERP